MRLWNDREPCSDSNVLSLFSRSLVQSQLPSSQVKTTFSLNPRETQEQMSSEATRPPAALVRSPSSLTRRQPDSRAILHESSTRSDIQNITSADLDDLESQDYERSEIYQSRRTRQSPHFLLGVLNRRREADSRRASMPDREVRPASDAQTPTDSGVAATNFHEEIVEIKSTGDYCFLCFTSGSPGREYAVKVSVDCPKLRLSYQCEKSLPDHKFGTSSCTIRSEFLEGSEDVPFAQLRKATFWAHGRWKTRIPYYDIQEVQEIRVRHMPLILILHADKIISSVSTMWQIRKDMCQSRSHIVQKKRLKTFWQRQGM